LDDDVHVKNDRGLLDKEWQKEESDNRDLFDVSLQKWGSINLFNLNNITINIIITIINSSIIIIINVIIILSQLFILVINIFIFHIIINISIIKCNGFQFVVMANVIDSTCWCNFNLKRGRCYFRVYVNMEVIMVFPFMLNNISTPHPFNFVRMIYTVHSFQSIYANTLKCRKINIIHHSTSICPYNSSLDPNVTV